MSLSVTDLVCRRAGRLVIGGLSFELAPGEALILRGPNGAGKSTLLRALAGLLPASGGAATLPGARLGVDPDAWAERIAYAGHLDAIKPQMTVGENLRFWAALFGAGPGAAERAAAGFGLRPISERRAQDCSAGQKRRLGLARLLLVPRALWLLDEPTVSLDAEAAGRFAEAVRGHCAAGGMALVATHVDLGLNGARELVLRPAEGPARMEGDPFLVGSFG